MAQGGELLEETVYVYVHVFYAFFTTSTIFN